MNKGVFIIAEAGVNHNGDVDIAKKLIDAAAKAGADAVKFQTFKAEYLVSKNAEKAKYQKETTDTNESQFDMIKKLELPYEAHKELIDYCNNKGIQFLSTAFEEKSAIFLHELDLVIFKIPSGEITNYPLLKLIGSFNKKVILSTGMSTIEEIKDALKVLKESGTEDITLLHCNTEYPTPYEDVNLLAMNTIQEATGIKVGYSDHTPGIEVSLAAVAMGACVIEKHFTLDKNMEGPDHKASLNPNELEYLVTSIRNIEKAMGDGIKKPSESELKNIDIVRKSIVAKCPIKKGELLDENKVTAKRPGNGISPMRWNEVLGTVAIKNFNEDDLIEL